MPGNTAQLPGIKKILIPLDGSAAAEAILPYIAGMAGHMGAGIILLTCVPQGLKSGVPERQYLEKAAALLRKRGLGVATVVHRGEPGPGILEASREYEAGLIALSAHLKPGGRKDLLGSVVADVLRSRAEPVLVLREEDGRAAEKGWTPPSAIIVGLDGSTLSMTALPHAEALADTFGSEVVLVRAVLPADSLSGAAKYYGAVDDFAERYLAGIAETLRQRGRKVATRTGHKAPDQEVLAAADSWPGSIIAMSTRGMTGRVNLMLGSVADRIIRAQRHPVLAIPAARGA